MSFCLSAYGNYSPHKRPARTVRGVCFEHSVLAATYSRLSTTIGADGLNCRVRKENGCFPIAKPPTQKAQTFCLIFYEKRYIKEFVLSVLLFDTRLPQFLSGVLSGY